jgi:hypothetical protein
MHSIAIYNFEIKTNSASVNCKIIHCYVLHVLVISKLVILWTNMNTIKYYVDFYNIVFKIKHKLYIAAG